MLEYLYLVSAFCIPVPKEIGEGFRNLGDVFGDRGSVLVVLNFSRFLGSILVELVSLDTCVESWSGLCFGKKIGRIGGDLLNTSVVSIIV